VWTLTSRHAVLFMIRLIYGHHARQGGGAMQAAVQACISRRISHVQRATAGEGAFVCDLDRTTAPIDRLADIAN
jgi:hypothetical protein